VGRWFALGGSRLLACILRGLSTGFLVGFLPRGVFLWGCRPGPLLTARFGFRPFLRFGPGGLIPFWLGSLLGERQTDKGQENHKSRQRYERAHDDLPSLVPGRQVAQVVPRQHYGHEGFSQLATSKALAASRWLGPGCRADRGLVKGYSACPGMNHFV